MDERERRRMLEAARLSEAAGAVEAALELYRGAGAVPEAARLLGARGAFAEAARLLLDDLGLPGAALASLQGEQRKRAYLAASYLSKAGEVGGAVELLVGLGEPLRAASLLESTGDFVGAERLRASPGHAALHERAPALTPPALDARARGALSRAHRLEQQGKHEAAVQVYLAEGAPREAGRVLARLGQFAAAAQAFDDAGCPYEAAVCQLHARDLQRALALLLRVPAGDAHYREAAVQAVRICWHLKRLDFQIEHFLTELIRTGPVATRDGELESFYALAELYEQHNFPEHATEVLRKLLAAAPEGFRDAAERLARVAQRAGLSADALAEMNREEVAFRGDRVAGSAAASPLTSGGRMRLLSELPGLPPLRDAAVRGTLVGTGPAAAPLPAAAAPQQPAEPPPAPSATTTFVIGRTLAGRYRLEAQIGQGGMALVFRAFDLELDESIALKVFLQATLDARLQEESLMRFKQELKLSRQLTHANIVRLYDIGLQQGHRYITMELLEGQALNALLRAGPLNVAQGLGYLVQACSGLQAAHDQGVIHRDIKPENIFITDDETVKILDFGIAKNTAVTGHTMAGMIAGTPEYMAPEQISDFSAVCAGTDIYALGVVAFAMFTGSLPFSHADLMALLMKHVNEEPPAPRALNPELPEDLEQLILRCLRKRPEERFASCRELSGQLQLIRRRFRR